MTLYSEQDFRSKPIPIPTFGESVEKHADFILPTIYKTPYPKSRADTTGIARPTHGAVHASRTAILIDHLVRLAQQYDPHFSLEDKYKKLLQIAALFHDSARENDGADRWEQESAENCYRYLKASGASEDDAQFAKEIIAGKEARKSIHELRKSPSLSAVTSPIQTCQLLLQSADCFDIIRCKDFFDITYLDIWHILNTMASADPSKDRAQFWKPLAEFADAASRLIDRQGDHHRMTDEKLKRSFELSPTCYKQTEACAQEIFSSLYAPKSIPTKDPSEELAPESLQCTEDRLVACRGLRSPEFFIGFSKKASLAGKEETALNIELRKLFRKTPQKDGNPYRSITTIGPGEPVFCGTGFIISAKRSALELVEALPVDSGTPIDNMGQKSRKKHYKTLPLLPPEKAQAILKELPSRMMDGKGCSNEYSGGYEFGHNETVMNIKPSDVVGIFYYPDHSLGMITEEPKYPGFDEIFTQSAWESFYRIQAVYMQQTAQEQYKKTFPIFQYSKFGGFRRTAITEDQIEADWKNVFDILLEHPLTRPINAQDFDQFYTEDHDVEPLGKHYSPSLRSRISIYVTQKLKDLLGKALSTDNTVWDIAQLQHLSCLLVSLHSLVRQTPDFKRDIATKLTLAFDSISHYLSPNEDRQLWVCAVDTLKSRAALYFDEDFYKKTTFPPLPHDSWDIEQINTALKKRYLGYDNPQTIDFTQHLITQCTCQTDKLTLDYSLVHSIPEAHRFDFIRFILQAMPGRVIFDPFSQSGPLGIIRLLPSAERFPCLELLKTETIPYLDLPEIPTDSLPDRFFSRLFEVLFQNQSIILTDQKVSATLKKELEDYFDRCHSTFLSYISEHRFSISQLLLAEIFCQRLLGSKIDNTFYRTISRNPQFQNQFQNQFQFQALIGSVTEADKDDPLELTYTEVDSAFSMNWLVDQALASSADNIAAKSTWFSERLFGKLIPKDQCDAHRLLQIVEHSEVWDTSPRLFTFGLSALRDTVKTFSAEHKTLSDFEWPHPSSIDIHKPYSQIIRLMCFLEVQQPQSDLDQECPAKLTAFIKALLPAALSSTTPDLLYAIFHLEMQASRLFNTPVNFDFYRDNLFSKFEGSPNLIIYSATQDLVSFSELEKCVSLPQMAKGIMQISNQKVYSWLQCNTKTVSQFLLNIPEEKRANFIHHLLEQVEILPSRPQEPGFIQSSDLSMILSSDVIGGDPLKLLLNRIVQERKDKCVSEIPSKESAESLFKTFCFDHGAQLLLNEKFGQRTCYYSMGQSPIASLFCSDAPFYQKQFKSDAFKEHFDFGLILAAHTEERFYLKDISAFFDTPTLITGFVRMLKETPQPTKRSSRLKELDHFLDSETFKQVSEMARPNPMTSVSTEGPGRRKEK